MRAAAALVAPLVAAALGCSAGSVTQAERACLDVADALGNAGLRCGEAYQANRDAFVRAVAGGSCRNVTRVRDDGLLRGACLPYIERAACDDLRVGKLDPACTDQLLREE